jgi:hypothetical protein
MRERRREHAGMEEEMEGGWSWREVGRSWVQMGARLGVGMMGEGMCVDGDWVRAGAGLPARAQMASTAQTSSR